MSFSLEDLDDAFEHDSLRAWLAGARFSDLGRVVELELELRHPRVEPEANEVVGRVGLRFRGVADWSLNARSIDGVRVADDHPALLPLVESRSRLSTSGEPNDPEATLAVLHLVHAREFGPTVATYLQPASSFPDGWVTGTVASGPTSLMKTYARVLEQHGLRTSLLPADDGPSSTPTPGLTAWNVGAGYVIATAVETVGDLPTLRA